MVRMSGQVPLRRSIFRSLVGVGRAGLGRETVPDDRQDLFGTVKCGAMNREDLHKLIDGLSDHELPIALQQLRQIRQSVVLPPELLESRGRFREHLEDVQSRFKASGKPVPPFPISAMNSAYGVTTEYVKAEDMARFTPPIYEHCWNGH